MRACFKHAATRDDDITSNWMADTPYCLRIICYLKIKSCVRRLYTYTQCLMQLLSTGDKSLAPHNNFRY